jgi:hypothetical protein
MGVLLENMQSVERQLRALGCRRQARRALRTRWRANQILIVDEVLAVGDAEFQKMPGQNEGCRQPWPHDSLELKKGTAVFSRGEFKIDKR